jgi:hypothetical protein
VIAHSASLIKFFPIGADSGREAPVACRKYQLCTSCTLEKAIAGGIYIGQAGIRVYRTVLLFFPIPKRTDLVVGVLLKVKDFKYLVKATTEPQQQGPRIEPLTRTIVVSLLF